MIQSFADRDPDGLRLCLRPNRSLSARGLALAFAVIACTCLAVALYSAAQGNVFAPWFAFIDLALLAWAFKLVWRASERAEWIDLSDGALTVRSERGGRCIETGRFHPYWVRVETAGKIRRVLLRSHGKALCIGAFLGEEERGQLAETLRLALARRHGPERSHGIETNTGAGRIQV